MKYVHTKHTTNSVTREPNHFKRTRTVILCLTARLNRFTGVMHFLSSPSRTSTRQQPKQFISANPSVMFCRIKYVCVQYAPNLRRLVLQRFSGHLLDCNKTREIKITNIQNIMFSLPLRYQKWSKIPLRWQLHFSI